MTHCRCWISIPLSRKLIASESELGFREATAASSVRLSSITLSASVRNCRRVGTSV